MRSEFIGVLRLSSCAPNMTRSLSAGRLPTSQVGGQVDLCSRVPPIGPGAPLRNYVLASDLDRLAFAAAANRDTAGDQSHAEGAPSDSDSEAEEVREEVERRRCPKRPRPSSAAPLLPLARPRAASSGPFAIAAVAARAPALPPTPALFPKAMDAAPHRAAPARPLLGAPSSSPGGAAPAHSFHPAAVAAAGPSTSNHASWHTARFLFNATVKEVIGSGDRSSFRFDSFHILPDNQDFYQRAIKMLPYQGKSTNYVRPGFEGEFKHLAKVYVTGERTR